LFLKIFPLQRAQRISKICLVFNYTPDIKLQFVLVKNRKPQMKADIQAAYPRLLPINNVAVTI